MPIFQSFCCTTSCFQNTSQVAENRIISEMYRMTSDLPNLPDLPMYRMTSILTVKSTSYTLINYLRGPNLRAFGPMVKNMKKSENPLNDFTLTLNTQQSKVHCIH